MYWSLKLVPFKSLGAVSYSPSIVTMAVPEAILEIFSVKEWPDLENRVRVHSRLLEMAPFDRSHTSSYSPSIYTWRYLVSFARYSERLIGRKSRNFYTPPVFSGTAGGDPVGISWRCLMLVKLEWLGYRTVVKLWRYVEPFSYNTSVSRTDGRTDRQTDGQNYYICMLTRYKIGIVFFWNIVYI